MMVMSSEVGSMTLVSPSYPALLKFMSYWSAKTAFSKSIFLRVAASPFNPTRAILSLPQCPSVPTLPLELISDAFRLPESITSVRDVIEGEY